MTKSNTATVAIAGTATVGVVAPGVAEKIVGVTTTITAARAAVVVEANDARRVLVVAQDAA